MSLRRKDIPCISWILQKRSVLQRIGLGGEAYTCLLSRNRKELYITCWGCDKVLIFNTDNALLPGEISVGDNPNDLCLTKNSRFFSWRMPMTISVSVIDVQGRKVLETLQCGLIAMRLPALPRMP